MRNLPIIQYWHQPERPASIEAMLDTFRECNPGMQHLVFSEGGAESFIAGHLGDREASAFRSCAVPAMQADYFRYAAVHVLGGMYFDADCRCVASLLPLLHLNRGELFRNARNTGINNGFLIFPEPRHPLPRLALDIATANVERRTSGQVWVATGPAVLMILVALRELGSFEAFASAVGKTLPPWNARVVDAALSTVGDYVTVEKAFEGVRVSPRTRLDGFVVHDGTHLPYKHTGDHVANFSGSIYR